MCLEECKGHVKILIKARRKKCKSIEIIKEVDEDEEEDMDIDDILENHLVEESMRTAQTEQDNELSNGLSPRGKIEAIKFETVSGTENLINADIIKDKIESGD
jgi:hypothetical protein